ncbi:MAG: hypothetical protein KC547_08265 [Anaerolineae bacterium]|nr:hypothetical protein [Anaerolineae bacterium]
MSYNTAVRCHQGGDVIEIATGGELRLSGGIITNAGSQASVIADATALTENSGAIGGTNDGDLPDLTSADAAANAAAVRECATAINTLTTKLNAVIAALEGAGITASS